MSRRGLLIGSAAAIPWLLTGSGTTAAADPPTIEVGPELGTVERRYHRRIGLFAKNLRTGVELSHRPDERFALCSTFKPLAAAAVLDGRLVTPDPAALQRRVHYPPSIVAGDVWAPYTRTWLTSGYVPTLAELVEVAVRDSDNGAANMVVSMIGGPTAVTALVRDLGDQVTRLDRWEPELSEFQPGHPHDTSTPRALGLTYVELLLGQGLRPAARKRLLGWMLGNRARPPFRRALPDGWKIADKTGSGSYATRNNVGIAWTPDSTPILVSCLTRADDSGARRLDAPLIEAFRVAVDRLR